MLKVLNVADGLGKLEKIADGLYRSGYWFRPGRGFNLIRVFKDPRSRSFRGGLIISSEETPNGRTFYIFRDDETQHGVNPPDKFEQKGIATTFEESFLSADAEKRLKEFASKLLRTTSIRVLFSGRTKMTTTPWATGLGGYIDLYASAKASLKIWLDRSQEEGDLQFYCGFDAYKRQEIEAAVNKVYGHNNFLVFHDNDAGDYVWNEYSGRIHLTNSISMADALLPRWDIFSGGDLREYYFGISQSKNESDEVFLKRAVDFIEPIITLMESANLTYGELAKKAEAWKNNAKGDIERKRVNLYPRNPYFVEMTLLNADGVCEACKRQAPFKTATGKPFLEVHHIEPLSEGGEDELLNMAAICPNCHREVHCGAEGEALNGTLRK